MSIAAGVKAGPVRINPQESVSISLGSQSVRGTAPMKLNNAGVSNVRASPVLSLNISTMQVAIARQRLTIVLQSTSILGVFSDPLRQITGHALVKIVAPDQKKHLASAPSEKYCRLAGVASTNDRHVRPLAQLCLIGSRSVVDTASLEAVATVDVQASVVGPGCDYGTSP